jgi:hypothetical protein
MDKNLRTILLYLLLVCGLPLFHMCCYLWFQQTVPWHLYVHVTMHRNKFLCNKTKQMHQFYKFDLSWNSTFRTVHLSIIRSLFTVHSAMVYVIQVCWQLSSRTCLKAVYKPVWHIPLLSVQWINSWRWTDELSETCRVSWQNKFVKLVHLVGFITKKCTVAVRYGHKKGPSFKKVKGKGHQSQKRFMLHYYVYLKWPVLVYIQKANIMWNF